MYTIQDELSADVKSYAYHRKMMSEMGERIDHEARELLSELRKVKGWQVNSQPYFTVWLIIPEKTGKDWEFFKNTNELQKIDV